MRQGIVCSHELDDDGNPAGGTSQTVGALIDWQDGPLGRGEDREAPNGAFVEDIIMIAVDRLQWYQKVGDGKFRCRQNALAITKLEEAILWLDHRSADRQDRMVEGTHEP